MMKLLLASIAALIINVSWSQRKITTVMLETGNAVTALPIVGAPQLFKSNYHSYTSIGARMVWKDKNKHAWEQSFTIGFLHHRFIQKNIPVFTEIIYCYHAGRFDLRAHLGIGYLHNIPEMQRFKLNEQGEYERIRNIGRAQGMGKLSFSGTYRINNSYGLSMNYGILMQSPFVKSYVPLLPYNTLQVGVHKFLNKS